MMTNKSYFKVPDMTEERYRSTYGDELDFNNTSLKTLALLNRPDEEKNLSDVEWNSLFEEREKQGYYDRNGNKIIDTVRFKEDNQLCINMLPHAESTNQADDTQFYDLAITAPNILKAAKIKEYFIGKSVLLGYAETAGRRGFSLFINVRGKEENLEFEIPSNYDTNEWIDFINKNLIKSLLLCYPSKFEGESNIIYGKPIKVDYSMGFRILGNPDNIA